MSSDPKRDATGPKLIPAILSSEVSCPIHHQSFPCEICKKSPESTISFYLQQGFLELFRGIYTLSQNLLDLASRFHDIGVELAKKLHNGRVLYGIYGGFDGLNSAYSIFKLFFDLWYSGTGVDATDALHEWMLTALGMLIASAGTLIIIIYSILGNYYKDKEELLKGWIANSWPYIRDCIKASKNAFKGLRATLLASTVLTHTPFLRILVPGSLALGMLAVVNRLLLRRMYGLRKSMMSENENQKSSEMDIEKIRVHRQNPLEQRLAFLGAAFGGIVDGMYMYVGVLGLALSAGVSPPVFAFLAACSAIYLISCITTRIYEEYLYQLKLEITAVDLELYIARQREEHGKELLLQNKLKTCQEALSAKPWHLAFLMGIRHGLSAYGVLTSCMFTVATIMAFCSAALPATVLFGVVSLGLATLTLFLVHSFYAAWQYRKQGQPIRKDPQITQPDEKMDQSPQFFFQEWFEVVRSFFSGLGKGPKSIDYAVPFFQEIGEDGHYHHVNIAILCMGGVSALSFSLSHALRALCKGFGKPLEGQSSTKKSVTVPSPSLEKPDQNSSAKFRETPSENKNLLSKHRSGFFSISESTTPHAIPSGKLQPENKVRERSNAVWQRPSGLLNANASPDSDTYHQSGSLCPHSL